MSTESRTETVPERRFLRSRADTREWLQERIDGRVALAVGVAWFVLNEIAYALEPAAQQSVPVIGIVLEVTMYVLLAAMLAGLVMQRRWGLLASFGAARARDRGVDRVPGHRSPRVRYVVVRADGVHARARRDQRRRPRELRFVAHCEPGYPARSRSLLASNSLARRRSRSSARRQSGCTAIISTT